MRIIGHIIMLGALGALACSDNPTEPSPYGEPLRITATPTDPGTDTASQIYIGWQNTLFYFTGRITTPSPCYGLSAYRTIQGNDLRVTIVATRSAKDCPSMISSLDYQVLTDRPDCAHLTVTYHYEGADWPDRKLVDLSWPCASATTARAVRRLAA
jgi:hypothetical protein